MSTQRCSMCGKKIDDPENTFVPFCSRRCQQLDLGNWLDEHYGLPWEDPVKESESDHADSGLDGENGEPSEE